MKSIFVLSSLLAAAFGFPQEIAVVRPNHYLSQGTYQDGTGKEQHLLPGSFYSSGQQAVQTDIGNLASSSSVPQIVTLQAQTSVPATNEASKELSTKSTSSGESGQDSYSNIGGASGRVASSLTAAHEYGETLPQAFTNLQQDSYAFYQGHKQN